MKKRTKILLMLGIMAIILLVTFIVLQFQKPVCKPEREYSSQELCYCPTDKMTPFGYPEAMWRQLPNGNWTCFWTLYI